MTPLEAVKPSELSELYSPQKSFIVTDKEPGICSQTEDSCTSTFSLSLNNYTAFRV